MDEPEVTKAGPKNPSPAAPSHMNWDTSRQESHDCTLATASVTPMEVIVNFGAKRGRDHPGGEVGVELLRRIALKPLTAKHLAATLERVLTAYDGGAQRSRQ
jgi:hypothetical protein